MKIAILSPWSISPNAIGGTERFVLDLANSFINLNNVVDVYMLSGEDYSKNNIHFKNINLFETTEKIDEYFLRKKFNDFSLKDSYDNLAKKIEKLVDFSEYDLIHLNSQLFLKVCKNKKRIFTIHTNPFEYKLDWGKAAFDTMLSLMAEEGRTANTYFVTPSEYYANQYKNLTNIDIKFIPHAIDIERLKVDKTREEILSEIGVANDKNIILLPSRLEPIQKQPMLFMEAFSKINDNTKQLFKVICTGADTQYIKHKEEIEQFCKENDIDILVTRFDTMADAYKIANVVILPSKSESFGYSALESLSLGIPTIINDIPTYKEVANGSKNYYMFSNTVKSLYRILSELLNNDLNRIVQPEDWLMKYSVELFAKRYLDLFSKESFTN